MERAIGRVQTQLLRFRPTPAPLLSLLVWTPAAGSILALLSGKHFQRGVALVSAAAPIAMALARPASVTYPWTPSLGASYDLAVDGLGLVLCVLVSLLAMLAIALEGLDRKATILILSTQSALLGLFCARDALLLLVFLGGAMTCLTVLEGHRFFSIQWVGFALLSAYFVLCYQLAEAQSGFPTSSIERFESLVAFPTFAAGAFLLGASGPVIMMLGAKTKGSLLSLAGYWVVPCYLLLRLVASVFPDGARQQAPLMFALGLLGLASAGLWPRTRIHNAYQGLVLLGLFSFRAEGIVAAEIEMVHLGLALATIASCRPARTTLEAVVVGVIVLIPPGVPGLVQSLPPKLLVAAGLLYAWVAFRFIRHSSRDSFHELRPRRRETLIPLLGLWIALVVGRPALSETLSVNAEKLIRSSATSEEP